MFQKIRNIIITVKNTLNEEKAALICDHKKHILHIPETIPEVNMSGRNYLVKSTNTLIF